MKTLVLGLGVSGKAAVSFLIRIGQKVIAVDQKIDDLKKRGDLDYLEQKSVLFLKDNQEVDFKDIEQLIISPGVDPKHRLVQKAIERGVEVIGEAELAFRYLNNTILAITGSNGKTTTTLLTTFILNEVHKNTRALGNVGNSLADYLLDPKDDEILVVELSSFQLESLKSKKVNAASILNISANHLDRYESFLDYAKAKCHLQTLLKPSGEFFVSRQVISDFADILKRENLKCFDDIFNSLKGEKLFALMQEKSAAERENMLASFALCSTQGVTAEEFVQIYPKFKKPPHRIEFVAEINGICFYNDSKATSIEPVIHAVNTMRGGTILIAGGKDKGLSYESWNEAFSGRVKKIFAIGECAAKIAAALARFEVEVVSSLEDAVLKAFKEAKKGESVLLSPGCSSYDMFKNYEERGDEFKRVVKAIEKKVCIE